MVRAVLILLGVLAFLNGVLFAQADFEKEIEAELAGAPDSSDKAEESGAQGDGRSKSNQGASVIDRANIPNIWVVADFTSEQYLEEANEHNHHIARVREVELGLNAAIDQLAVGTVTMAVHNEQGALFWELHEAFLEFNNLPADLYFKFGRMFPDLGRLNTMHIHSRPFTFAPIIHREIFGDDEGALDTGGELSYIMPWNFYQEIKFGAFNGRFFGHTHNDGRNKPLPLLTARVKNFLPLVGNWGIQFGFTGARYNPTSGRADDVDWTSGSDFQLKWLKGKLQSFELGGEVWYRKSPRVSGNDEDIFGYYVFAEYKPWQMWKFGVRYDAYLEIDKYSAALDKRFDAAENGQMVWVTFAPSEFSYYRLSLSREDIFLQDKDDIKVIAQVDYTIGYHPPHRY